MVRVRVVMAAALAGLAAVAAACAGGRANPAAVQVAITGDEQQRIDGWGVAVVNDDPGEPLLRPGVPLADVALMDRLVFRGGGINLVRVFTPGWGSERAAGRVGPPVASDARWAFMRRVRKYGVRFMLTGGDAPASMLSARVPASRLLLGKPLAAGQEKAYARYLASILTFANRMGVPFDYAAIANEPDNSRNLLTLTSAQAAEVYSELARIIHARGLRTKLVLGDDTGWPSTLSYAKAELGAPGVHASTAVVASHSYYGTSNDRAALARFAHQAGLGVWQTEWTSNCSTCNGRGPAATEQMLDWSKQITAALVEADARAWFTFEAVADGGTGALITRQQQSQVPFAPTKRFYLLEQYTHAAPPGSQRLAVKQRGRQDAISAVAFRSDSGESVVLTNYAATDETISLDLGKSSGRITARRTAQSDNFRPLPPATYRGRPLRVTLPKQSITTLFLTT